MKRLIILALALTATACGSIPEHILIEAEQFDCYGPYAPDASVNPQGPSEGAYAVLRGGGIFGGTNSCRVTYRSFDAPESTLAINGFRLVCTGL
ncbi:MAG: hypothetical protein IJU68_01110 [Bacteroidales bacterium]|nr:hypothetical protein [Bacteroidales bacterium]